MALINPNAGLLTAAVVFGFFGLMQMMFPVSFMKQYGIDVAGSLGNSTTAASTAEKLFIATSLQTWGVTLSIPTAFSAITFRNGNDGQKSMINLMNGANCLIQSIIVLCTVSYWDTIVATTGLYINFAIFLVVAVVCLLGVDFPPKIELANVRKPLYFGFIGMAVLYALYMLLMAFATESLFANYGAKLKEGVVKKLLVGMYRFGFAPTFLHIVTLMLAQIITAGPIANYGCARYMAIVSFASMLMCAVMAAVWTCLGSGIIGGASVSFDGVAKGQTFNMFLWFIFFMLFYYPVALMDKEIKEPVETFIGAAATKKKVAKKSVPAAAAPAAAEPVAEVQPLLPPLMPLATSPLQPSYSMVQQPYTYAPTTTAYAPATYVTAAPATTAYTTAPIPAGYTTGGVV